MRGVLIAFEGIDGSGKTTQALLAADWLAGLGVDIVRTKEPTTGPWGQRIRASKTQGRMPPEEELAAFLADRREHVASLIRPALDRGAVVIVDRYYYSTVAYQGARGLDAGELLRRNREFAPTPDVVVLLDVDPRVGLGRIARRGNGQADLFETLDELTRAREIFNSLTEPHIFRIDGTQPIPSIHSGIVFRLSKGPLAKILRSLKMDGPTEPMGDVERELAAEAEAIAHDPNIPENEKPARLLAWLRQRQSQ